MTRTQTTEAPLDSTTIIERGRRVLALEAEALHLSEQALGEPFADAVRLLASCTGRIIVAGVGKSGLVGRKIAAT
ncbi:MAG: KpsF/GutQ family sugar-phosphate isomerase, partial [Gemmatimonas sp.]|nr:KpsF/GutQ family sugar-phosphate isomerase [Gemmatimonas sp.]